MKNLTVYIGTIQKCMNLEKYKKSGHKRMVTQYRENTQNTEVRYGFIEEYTKPVNKQAILIKNKKVICMNLNLLILLLII